MQYQIKHNVLCMRDFKNGRAYTGSILLDWYNVSHINRANDIIESHDRNNMRLFSIFFNYINNL